MNIRLMFLIVSIVSLMIQSHSATRIFCGIQRPGLRRTAACRVGVAILYVVLGIITLYTPFARTGVYALTVFSFTQCVWIINGLLDSRLARKGRHHENIN